MNIQKVQAVNFKNYAELEFSPSPSCNVLSGINGAGKTNFLDLVHFACLGKSYFPIYDKEAIRQGSDFFRVECTLSEEDTQENHTIKLSVPQTGKKKIWKNGALLEKNTDLLGLIPIVALVPDDIELIKGGSALRRKFMDRVLCQISKAYTESLIKYRKVLSQKLALLKNTRSLAEIDKDLLNSYHNSLHEYAQIIAKSRSSFTASFQPIFKNLYREIAEDKEDVMIEYSSNYGSDKFVNLAEKTIEKDFFTGRVHIGIHRDDLIFSISGNSARKFGSQGQIKTFVYALKLGEYLYLSEMVKSDPILLLDDVFEKLDRFRLRKLFELINSDRFGQIFIMDTESERSLALLTELNASFKCFLVENNSIVPFTKRNS